MILKGMSDRSSIYSGETVGWVPEEVINAGEPFIDISGHDHSIFDSQDILHHLGKFLHEPCDAPHMCNSIHCKQLAHLPFIIGILVPLGDMFNMFNSREIIDDLGDNSNRKSLNKCIQGIFKSRQISYQCLRYLMNMHLDNFNAMRSDDTSHALASTTAHPKTLFHLGPFRLEIFFDENSWGFLYAMIGVHMRLSLQGASQVLLQEFANALFAWNEEHNYEVNAHSILLRWVIKNNNHVLGQILCRKLVMITSFPNEIVEIAVRHGALYALDILVELWLPMNFRPTFPVSPTTAAHYLIVSKNVETCHLVARHCGIPAGDDKIWNVAHAISDAEMYVPPLKILQFLCKHVDPAPPFGLAFFKNAVIQGKLDVACWLRTYFPNTTTTPEENIVRQLLNWDSFTRMVHACTYNLVSIQSVFYGWSSFQRLGNYNITSAYVEHWMLRRLKIHSADQIADQLFLTDDHHFPTIHSPKRQRLE